MLLSRAEQLSRATHLLGRSVRDRFCAYEAKIGKDETIPKMLERQTKRRHSSIMGDLETIPDSIEYEAMVHHRAHTRNYTMSGLPTVKHLVWPSRFQTVTVMQETLRQMYFITV